jgi:glycerophosphoryl diester phosphodiesterase
LPIYEALRNSRIKHVLTRHEQAAIHAADSYARISGKCGVCLATAGPGAMNLVMGVSACYKDNVPVLVHADKDGNLKGYFKQGGNVKYLTWEQLSKFRTIKDNLLMPRLIDAMELAKNKLFMNLEIKDPRVELVFPQLIKLIEEYDFFDQIALSSLYFNYFEKVEEYNSKNDKQLVFGFIYKKGMQKFYDFTKRGHTLNIYWEDITKEICNKAHENGMAVVGWFKMIEDENLDHYKKIINDGVDVICANYPLIAKKYRDSIYNERRLNIFDYLQHILYKE